MVNFKIIDVDLEAYIGYKTFRVVHFFNLVLNATFLTQETYALILLITKLNLKPTLSVYIYMYI